MTVAHAALCDDVIGEMLYLAHIPFQDGDFETIIMINMHMKCGDGEIMVMVLRRNNPAGQVTFLVFIDIREDRKTLIAVLLCGFLRQRTAQNVSNRFGAVVIATALAQTVQCFKELVVEGDSDTLHRHLTLRDGATAHGISGK